jgi:hypothetical protein
VASNMKTSFISNLVYAALFSYAMTLHAPLAFAMSSTDRVAWPGKPATAVAGWPEGTLALVNDPLRTDGWHPWFSECPNDVNFYEYRIRDTGDVNRLLQLLAAIKATNATLRLNPEPKAAAIGFTTTSPETNRTALVLSVGNQTQLNAWHQHLPVDKAGIRKFGVHRYTNAPLAAPPTLTLYVGHAAVDLQKLQVPDSVTVLADIQPSASATSPISKAIETFINSRKQGLSKPTSNAK